MNDRSIDNYISESKMTSHRGKFLFAAVVLCAALGYFAYMAFQGAMVYYFTVSEISGQPATAEGRTVRVSGKLKPGSFHRVEGSTLAHFALVDGIGEIGAVHNGVLPDLFFNEHSEIILEGTHTPGQEFDSQIVIVKCPSKYVAMEESEEDKS
ncbi:MAG TPA: cytochrome c maturation protein CcmE [Dehalococcoidia bacterium]|mgnify:FL=1|jgi:cytochrome c-type biogenesis protein CcmE|nr:cytochrome c maturation protein CcmE [Dehalococcoidia bacterium]